MKLAAVDFWIWLIVFVFVLISKVWNKLATPSDDDQPAKPPPPTTPRARPTPQSRPQQPQRPAKSVSAPPGARRPSMPPPVITEAPDWRIDPQKIREFFEKVQAAPQPPARPTPPPVAAARPVPAPPPPVKAAPVTAAPKPATPAPAPASQWAAAFRDRQNLRNIIISNEILGPPKGA